MKKIVSTLIDDDQLFSEISILIEQCKQQVVSQVNSSLTILFWQIGNHIYTAILNKKRGEYGKQIVVTLSRQLEVKHGRNFAERNLRWMMQFATDFSDLSILSPLATKLS